MEEGNEGGENTHNHLPSASLNVHCLFFFTAVEKNARGGREGAPQRTSREDPSAFHELHVVICCNIPDE